jgi:Fic family protein
MRREDFADSAPGKCVLTPEGYVAFVPDPLPPSLEPSWRLHRADVEARAALGELAGLARNVANPHLLIRPFVRREAVLSSAIEGTVASPDQLVLFELDESAVADQPDVREVHNYVEALEYGLAQVRSAQGLPLSLRLLREMHGRLMHGVRGAQKTPGEFRRTQNYIRSGALSLAEAQYVPPPPAEMGEALGHLEAFLHTPSELPPLVRIALVHYQFEAIHPFGDGNGRIGRLLVSLLLCAEGLLPEPLLYLSAFFESNRSEYYDRLLAISLRGSWEEWLLFFLRGVAEQCADAVGRTGRVLQLWEAYRETLQVRRGSAVLLGLVDWLFASPAVSVSLAARVMGVTPAQASKHIRRLCEAGILREVTGRRRRRIFVAEGILRAIDDPLPPGPGAAPES